MFSKVKLLIVLLAVLLMAGVSSSFAGNVTEMGAFVKAGKASRVINVGGTNKTTKASKTYTPDKTFDIGENSRCNPFIKEIKTRSITLKEPDGAICYEAGNDADKTFALRDRQIGPDRFTFTYAKDKIITVGKRSYRLLNWEFKRGVTITMEVVE